LKLKKPDENRLKRLFKLKSLDKVTVYKISTNKILASYRVKKKQGKQDGRHGNNPKRFLVFKKKIEIS
jgi:hypothetical protein